MNDDAPTSPVLRLQERLAAAQHAHTLAGDYGQITDDLSIVLGRLHSLLSRDGATHPSALAVARALLGEEVRP